MGHEVEAGFSLLVGQRMSVFSSLLVQALVVAVMGSDGSIAFLPWGEDGDGSGEMGVVRRRM